MPTPLKNICLLATLSFLLPAYTAWGDTAVDDVLRGFHPSESLALPEGNGGEESARAGTGANSRPALRFSGQAGIFGSYSYRSHTPPSGSADYRGLTSLRPRLDLALDVRLPVDWQARLSGHGFYDLVYSLRDRNDFTAEVLSQYENELELDEGYARGRLSPSLDIQLGRQVVNWGQADLLRVVDVLNPVDNREPGLVDAEHSRLPVLMSRIDCFRKSWRLTGIVVHEFRHNKDPAYGNDFYPFDFPPPPREKVPADLGSQGVGISAGSSLFGWDLTVHAASYLSEQQLVGLTEDIALRRINRLTMIGATGAKAITDWVFKFEAASVSGLRFYALPDSGKTRLDVLAGLEYTGLVDTRIHLELLWQHLYNLETSGVDQFDLPRSDSLIWVLYLSHALYNDRLRINFRALNLGIDFTDGSAQKLACTYELTDAVSVSGGVIVYHGGDNYVMKNIGNNDRVFLSLQYGF